MQTFLTDKSINITAVYPESFELQDALGNKLVINEKYNPLSLKNDFGITPCFVKEFHSAEPFQGAKERFSLICTHNPLISLRVKIHDLLLILRQIEDLVFHLVSNHIIDDDILFMLKKDNELRVQIKEGKIDRTTYEKIINGLSKQNKNISNGLLAKTEIARMGDLIRTELCHSEFSIIQSVNFLSTLIASENSRIKISTNSERLCYGYFTDACVWSFVDSIKAMSTTLDMLAKFVKFVTDTKFNDIPKTKSLIFGNLSYHKSWDKFLTKQKINIIKKIFEELKLVIRLRHDLTHNSGLFSLQNFVFVGFKTPNIKNLSLSYADLPLWDHDGTSFYSAQKTLGFFSQQNNAIEFAVKNIISTSILVELLFKVLRFELIDKCKSQGITRFNSIEWRNTSVLINRFTLNELEKLVI